MFPEEGFVIKSGKLAGHGVVEVMEVRLEAQVTGIDQVGADLPILIFRSAEAPTSASSI